MFACTGIHIFIYSVYLILLYIMMVVENSLQIYSTFCLLGSYRCFKKCESVYIPYKELKGNYNYRNNLFLPMSVYTIFTMKVLKKVLRNNLRP